jgi:hypothetical protein
MMLTSNIMIMTINLTHDNRVRQDCSKRCVLHKGRWKMNEPVFRDLGGTSLSFAKGVAIAKTTPFAKPQGVPPFFIDFPGIYTSQRAETADFVRGSFSSQPACSALVMSASACLPSA